MTDVEELLGRYGSRFDDVAPVEAREVLDHVDRVRPHRPARRWLAVAAAAVVVLGIGLALRDRTGSPEPVVTTTPGPTPTVDVVNDEPLSLPNIDVKGYRQQTIAGEIAWWRFSERDNLPSTDRFRFEGIREGTYPDPVLYFSSGGQAEWWAWAGDGRWTTLDGPPSDRTRGDVPDAAITYDSAPRITDAGFESRIIVRSPSSGLGLVISLPVVGSIGQGGSTITVTDEDLGIYYVGLVQSGFIGDVRDDRGSARVTLPIEQHRGWSQLVDAGKIRWWRSTTADPDFPADFLSFAGVDELTSSDPAFYFRGVGPLLWRFSGQEWTTVSEVPDTVGFGVPGAAPSVPITAVHVPFGDYGVDIGIGDEVQRVLIPGVSSQLSYSDVNVRGSTIFAAGDSVIWIGIFEEADPS